MQSHAPAVVNNAMSELSIVIGNKNYSSWSLRGWLMVKATGREFSEIRLAMDTPQFHDEIGRYSPARRVPVIRHGELAVWDSLAIGEYLAEQFPRAGLWPTDAGQRARARCVSAEMHSGFFALRGELPMNCRARDRRVSPSEQASKDIARIQAMWRECRAEAGEGGPWLFGEFSIADCMYAPVALRFLTYGVPCGPVEHAYVETVLGHPPVMEWMEAAQEETEVIDREEVGR